VFGPTLCLRAGIVRGHSRCSAHVYLVLLSISALKSKVKSGSKVKSQVEPARRTEEILSLWGEASTPCACGAAPASNTLRGPVLVRSHRDLSKYFARVSEITQYALFTADRCSICKHSCPTLSRLACKRRGGVESKRKITTTHTSRERERELGVVGKRRSCPQLGTQRAGKGVGVAGQPGGMVYRVCKGG
jgi:hypothetical protein